MDIFSAKIEEFVLHKKEIDEKISFLNKAKQQIENFKKDINSFKEFLVKQQIDIRHVSHYGLYTNDLQYPAYCFSIVFGKQENGLQQYIEEYLNWIKEDIFYSKNEKKVSVILHKRYQLIVSISAHDQQIDFILRPDVYDHFSREKYNSFLQTIEIEDNLPLGQKPQLSIVVL